MSFDRKWWPTADSLGIPAEIWRLLSSLGERNEPALPRAVVGYKPHCVIPDEKWSQMCRELVAHAKDPMSVGRRQFVQEHPDDAPLREIHMHADWEWSARDRVASLLEWFEFDRGASIDIPKLRKTLQSRHEAIANVLKFLPPETEEETHFLRDTFAGSHETLMALWKDRFGNDPLRLALAVHAEAIKRTLELLPKGRRPEIAVDNLVNGLARVWIDVTGDIPRGSVRVGEKSFEGGAFANFVRAVIAELPLPHPSLDRPIRAAREAYARGKMKAVENRP